MDIRIARPAGLFAPVRQPPVLVRPLQRVIGTIRRECLDHVIVFNEASLYRLVKSFIAYYHESRTHLSLAKDAPESRPVQRADAGRIVSIPQVGGVHHRYECWAA